MSPHESWQKVTWQQGWVTLLHGANGAGKTTWLRQLAASWSPVYYSGHTLGWVPHLTVAENLRLWGKLYKQGSVTLNADCPSQPLHNIPWGDLSQGQKQYTAFLGACFSGCKLWLMDEPFAHMDAEYAKQTQDMCHQHCSSGGALVLTSHAPNIDFWPHVHAWLVA